MASHQTGNSEILESFCPGSRVHAIIHNPHGEGFDEG